ncbi:MAG: thymidine phosphorylase family protein [Sphingomonadales bacterium]
MTKHPNTLKLLRLGIDTHQETVVYMRQDCHICRAEGFAAHARVLVTCKDHSVIATLNHITTDILARNEASLSESAWKILNATEGDRIVVSHPSPLESLSHVRAKVYGKELDQKAFAAILKDVVGRRYSDIHLSSFITACSADGLGEEEMIALTRAMVDVGDTLVWDHHPIVDKHCVGGLPGNRTTPIVVAIAAAAGLVVPKTSSRAITSPAGTADTMEVMAPVDLDIQAMRRVVDQEGGCIVWGGAVQLSPADDIFISIERALDLDSEGQLVASILSKKIAAGSTHLVIDMPVGPTAKVRSEADAKRLAGYLTKVGLAFDVKVQVVATDGRQPVGRGIGPALEARDVLAVLRNQPEAPQDLRERACHLAGALLELGKKAPQGEGCSQAEDILGSGQAWEKFHAICKAQGGFHEPKLAKYTETICSSRKGRVSIIDNRLIARIGKLAGAPQAKAAGIEMHVKLDTPVEKNQLLFTIHAETKGELAYANDYATGKENIITIKEN